MSAESVDIEAPATDSPDTIDHKHYAAAQDTTFC